MAGCTGAWLEFGFRGRFVLGLIILWENEVNALVALLVALVVVGSFSICLSPVIAKFSAFTLLQSDLAVTIRIQFVTTFARAVCWILAVQVAKVTRSILSRL